MLVKGRRVDQGPHSTSAASPDPYGGVPFCLTMGGKDVAEAVHWGLDT